MWSTFWWWIWIAGVTHCRHEHFFPDHTTSPILALHFGQFSFASFSSPTASHPGWLIKYELHSTPWTTSRKRVVLQDRQRQQSSPWPSIVDYIMQSMHELAHNHLNLQILQPFILSFFPEAPSPNSHSSFMFLTFSSSPKCFRRKLSPLVPQLVSRYSSQAFTLISQLPKMRCLGSQQWVRLVLKAQMQVSLVRLQMKALGLSSGMYLGSGLKAWCVKAPMISPFSSSLTNKMFLIRSILSWKLTSRISGNSQMSSHSENARPIPLNLSSRCPRSSLGLQIVSAIEHLQQIYSSDLSSSSSSSSQRFTIRSDCYSDDFMLELCIIEDSDSLWWAMGEGMASLGTLEDSSILARIALLVLTKARLDSSRRLICWARAWMSSDRWDSLLSMRSMIRRCMRSSFEASSSTSSSWQQIFSLNLPLAFIHCAISMIIHGLVIQYKIAIQI